MSLKINNVIISSNAATAANEESSLYDRGPETSNSTARHWGGGVAVYPKNIPVDLELNEESQNPIANCAVATALKSSFAATKSNIAVKEFYTGNWGITDPDSQNLEFTNMISYRNFWQWNSNSDEGTINPFKEKESTSEDWINFLEKNIQNILGIQVLVDNSIAKNISLPCTSFNCSLLKVSGIWIIFCSSPYTDIFLNTLSPNSTFAWTPGIKMLYSPDFITQNSQPNEAAQQSIDSFKNSAFYNNLYAKIIIHYVQSSTGDQAEDITNEK